MSPQIFHPAPRDRDRDTGPPVRQTGQLYYPDGSGADAATSNLNGTPPNPDLHPFWNPEFVGDVVVVNGAPWPYLNIEPKRYRFRLLDGANARAFSLRFGTVPTMRSQRTKITLMRLCPSTEVLMLPGQRRDVIVDSQTLQARLLRSRTMPVLP
jgi:FtsP/CotA-like multicopper oxidase with cupredoxin domain